MTPVAGMVDAVKALRDDLASSRRLADRGIAERLTQIVDQYEVPLMPLDVNMGPAHHHPGHSTEITAADLVLPRAGILREKVIEALWRSICRVPPWDHGVLVGDLNVADDGMTQDEVARYTGVYLYSIAPRFAELVRMGWIKDSGRTRTSSRGTDAVVWELTEAGRVRWTAERRANGWKLG